MAYKDPKDPRLAEAKKRYYEKNKASYIERAKVSKAKLRQYVLDIKNLTPCVDCGVIYPGEPWLTEFDHIEDNKVNGISQLIDNGSLQKLIDEIAKCELRCLICHRRKTAERGGWLDNRHAHLL